jgi:site-specific recombinase XerD
LLLANNKVKSLEFFGAFLFVKKAGILKKVSVLSLRNSFATHLLENGTNLPYIKSLLGQSSSKTTEIYTQISTKGMEKIKSPLDNLDI